MNAQLLSVSFTYPSGVQALQDVSLALEPGEAVAIVGENGAGKTTLAKHLNGLLKPSQGRVLIGDWDTRKHTTARLARRVGYVFQNPDDQLFQRTVRAEVAFGPRNLGRSEREIGEAVDSTLAQVGLEHAAESHPYDLHASQRKLVALAATLAMQTPIVVLDEPTTGQDDRGIRRIGDIVQGLKGQGRSVLAISHDIDFCAEHFPRVVVMAQGQILADGPAGQVLAQVDLLRRAEVEAPELMRLALALGLSGSALTVETFLSLYRDQP